jgi:hypothetical protein
MILSIPPINSILRLDSKPQKGSLTNASYIQHGCNLYEINTGSEGEYEVRTDILYPAILQMEAMLSHHNKVYQIRLESHSKQYGSDNKAFTQMLRALKKWLISKGHKRVAYLWVREKEKEKGYHYHAVLWLDGNKIQNPWAVQQRWEELHRKRNHSQPWRVKPSTPMILRNKPETTSATVYVFSYLAKQRSKGYGNLGTRDFSTSSIQRKSQ